MPKHGNVSYGRSCRPSWLAGGGGLARWKTRAPHEHVSQTYAPSLPPSSSPHGAQRGCAVGRTTPSVRPSRYFLLVALPGNSGRGRHIGVSASACGLLQGRSMERRNAKLSQVRPCDGERVEAGRRRGQDVPRVPGLPPLDGRSRGKAPNPGGKPSPAARINPCRVTVPRPLARQKSDQERDELVRQITDYRRQLEATPLANMGRREDLAGRIRRAEKRLADIQVRLGRTE